MSDDGLTPGQTALVVFLAVVTSTATVLCLHLLGWA